MDQEALDFLFELKGNPKYSLDLMLWNLTRYKRTPPYIGLTFIEVQYLLDRELAEAIVVADRYHQAPRHLTPRESEKPPDWYTNLRMNYLQASAVWTPFCHEAFNQKDDFHKRPSLRAIANWYERPVDRLSNRRSSYLQSTDVYDDEATHPQKWAADFVRNAVQGSAMRNLRTNTRDAVSGRSTKWKKRVASDRAEALQLGLSLGIIEPWEISR